MVAQWQTGCDSSACVKVLVRDDKDLVLIQSTEYGTSGVFNMEEWQQFKQAVKDGKFD